MGLAGVVWFSLPVSNFTLAWMHSIEKIRWEEDYQLTGDGLLLQEARVKGAGAGMEVPDGAQFRAGTWHYQRTLPALAVLRLGRTPEAGDYELCLQQQCHVLSEWLGAPNHTQPALELWPCTVD